MDTAFDDDEDDLPENEYRSRVPAVEHSVADLLRPVAAAARSIYDREQKADVISGLVMTLTNRAMKATARAGKLSGYNQKLQEELKRQLDVQSQLAAKVAWYELKTQIVIGGRISSDGYANGPHATGIRCDRCHRQVEDRQIIDHLMEHVRDDEIEERVAKQRREELMRAEYEKTHPPVKPKRVRKKKEPAAPA